ncbi:MAG TPA: nucleotide sugar dehydrogenase [Gammaproteobacteria bacterium]|jgi:GDP-mannose 6-dehydrogenase|nr:nucleotide sugar dehydrogenase [Gammaproteobacteria bacterium]
MRISIFGLGYVGCVSAARFAEAGHQVIGVDVNPEKVAMVNGGLSPIVEPGLEALLAFTVANGRLRATTSAAEGIANSDMALICVGTPGYANGQLNVDILRQLSSEIGRELHHREKPFTVVVRSTVLPGTVEEVVFPAIRAGIQRRDRSFLSVAVNPEFIREGSALQDFLQPPFTLVGCQDGATAAKVRELYANVDAPFVSTSIRTAEMIKYTANTFHALKVCFANEVGDACEAFGVEPQEVMRIFRMDRKLNVSEAYLKPGFAFGGSCLPKDIRALTYAARSADVELPLISRILESNGAQIRRAVDTVLATHKRRIGVLGLSFKPGTDDLRESPMVTLVENLIGKGLEVRILDHNVAVARLTGANRRYIEEEIPHISSLMCTEAVDLLNHAELLVVGNAGEETNQVLAAAPELPVIDLTRGIARVSRVQTKVEEPCQQPSSSGSYTPAYSLQGSPAHS